MEYGLIGKKLSHSFSKEIHSEFALYSYDIVEISPESLDGFMNKRDFLGINVTVPYKESVIPYLHEISDEAKRIGAVNTVLNKNGLLYGYNTDYYGLKSLILKNGFEIAGKKALILGSGGTSKTAHAVLEDLGAAEIITVSRAEKEGAVSYETALSRHLDADFILNATPVGMFPATDASPIPLEPFKKLSGVIDVIYNPLSTRLLSEAKEKGIKAVNGLYMLVSQAVKAAELFTGKEIADETADAVWHKLLLSKQNTVLIGMPSSGKSTVGAVLAKLLSKKLTDTDAAIVKKAGASIPEIFSRFGEERFRDIEAEVIKEVSLSEGAVIATGGGVIKREENVLNLKKNGKVFFINRSPDRLITTDDRPLSNDREKLEKLFNERYPLYLKAADHTVSGDLSPEEIAREIMRLL